MRSRLQLGHVAIFLAFWSLSDSSDKRQNKIFTSQGREDNSVPENHVFQG